MTPVQTINSTTSNRKGQADPTPTSTPKENPTSSCARTYTYVGHGSRRPSTKRANVQWRKKKRPAQKGWPFYIAPLRARVRSDCSFPQSWFPTSWQARRRKIWLAVFCCIQQMRKDNLGRTRAHPCHRYRIANTARINDSYRVTIF